MILCINYYSISAPHSLVFLTAPMSCSGRSKVERYRARPWLTIQYLIVITYLLLYFNTFVLLVIISNTIYHIINKIYHNKVNIFIFTVSFKVKTTLNINTQVHMTKQTKNSPI
jgi:hypothetical protein